MYRRSVTLPALVWRSRARSFAAAGLVAAAFLLVGAVGCGGGDWPRVVSVPADRMEQVNDLTDVRRMVLPESQPFNVHDRRSSQNPGQTGEARGESDAKAEGTAYCRAEAADGGTASADFLLGHVVHSATDRAVNVLAEFSFESDQRLTVSDDADTHTHGDYQLEAYVRDSNKRTIRRVPVAVSASDTGPRTATGKAVIEVAFDMQPGTAYHVLLAGKVAVETVEGAGASAAVEVKNLRIELTFAPPTSTAPSTGG